LDNLHASSSFPKIRNNTKIYNTHLLDLGSQNIYKNYTLAEHYNNSTDPLNALDYTINRPSNSLASISYLNVGINNLNSQTFRNFLNLNESNTSVSNLTENKVSESVKIPSHYLLTNTELLSLPSLSDSEDKILPTEQFVQQQKVFNPLKNGTNPTLISKNYSAGTPNNTLLLQDLGSNLNLFSIDYNFGSNLATRIFTSRALPPVLSSTSNRAENFTSVFDGTELTKEISVQPTTLSLNSTSSPNTTVEANVGSIEKIPTPLIEMY